MGGIFNVVFKIFSTLLGLLLILLGLVWIGQAFHVGPAFIMRGGMVSHHRWALWGTILALFGLGQVIWSMRRPN
ncbi:MAG TPA: hypothetical protein VME40_07610 [Caulobacteraceae bacterium]|nr:hypothetical protein [Caulobacteraceae bacterium]